MISKIELARIAEMKHLTIRNAEKDYLLELLLFSLSDDRCSLVFKGGTSLYKFYNLNRFSEDLDFDGIGKRMPIDTLIKKSIRNFELMGMQRTLHEKNEYRNEINIRFTIRGPLYDGSKNSMARITLNISTRERPLSSQMKLLIASFPEIPSFELSVLDIEEIAAEKIGCILTREKPRDIYDLWFLSKKGVTLDVSLSNKKLKIYDLIFNQQKFIEKVYEKEKMWKRDLQDLIIGTLPKFDEVVTELIEWIKIS
ncbi:MAG: nucleotidyl transferase AbiEii/AbiGii toxin family protein [Candidatus Thermoplasmatota archaeon]|nr:nucleotidyl transferase AbiEii/AbiGii toxin family protein [Candidatus Thermoplasmatota archaeon]MBU1941928.1 nucleotidyl transferase AbiEii/AbiGii toxin family protein [Candidatus Thermoplasmatota archaeon]